MLRQRQERIARSMADADAARESAAKTQQEYDRRLVEAQRKAQEIIGQAAQQAEQVAAGIRAEAQRDAEAIREKARQEALEEKGRAVGRGPEPDCQPVDDGHRARAAPGAGREDTAATHRAVTARARPAAKRRVQPEGCIAMALDDRAHTYASALYDTAWDRWLAALQEVADKLAQNPNLAARLGAPGADVPQQQRVIDGLLPPDVDLPVRNFVYLLGAARRPDLARRHHA